MAGGMDPLAMGGLGVGVLAAAVALGIVIRKRMGKEGLTEASNVDGDIAAAAVWNKAGEAGQVGKAGKKVSPPDGPAPPPLLSSYDPSKMNVISLKKAITDHGGEPVFNDNKPSAQLKGHLQNQLTKMMAEAEKSNPDLDASLEVGAARGSV